MTTFFVASVGFLLGAVVSGLLFGDSGPGIELRHLLFALVVAAAAAGLEYAARHRSAAERPREQPD